MIAKRHAEVLNDIVEVARMQSTEGSNKIEGIYTSDERLRKIVLDKTMPRSRNEREIAGYKEALNTIHENHEHIPVKSTFILQRHRDLYKFESGGMGGIFKNVDNIIEEKNVAGVSSECFLPVAAGKTPEEVERLCEAYHNAITRTEADPLLIIPMFILDFLCIHPFQNGNGRMSRLLTLLLLYKSEYIVGKYVRIEKLIERTKDSYYAALQDSSGLWHEAGNDYAPFAAYLLGVIAAACGDFFERTRLLEEKTVAKPDCVAEAIKEQTGTITKSEIMQKVPGVSQTTVQRTLTELTKQGRIKKTGNGRYTKYTWTWENE